LWELLSQSGDVSAQGLEKLKDQDVFKKVVKIGESNNSEQDSFFTLFSFVSSYRFVDSNESEEAEHAAEERHARRKNGETLPDPLPESGWHGAEDIMPCPHGEELAVVLVDDVFPHAIRYFSKITNEKKLADKI
jgi:hypothetical protein